MPLMGLRNAEEADSIRAATVTKRNQRPTTKNSGKKYFATGSARSLHRMEGQQPTAAMMRIEPKSPSAWDVKVRCGWSRRLAAPRRERLSSRRGSAKMMVGRGAGNVINPAAATAHDAHRDGGSAPRCHLGQ